MTDDTMTEQEAYDYRRRAKYAREKKATEAALKPRMVTPGPTWNRADRADPHVRAKEAADDLRKEGEVRLAADRLRKVLRTRDD